MDALTQFVSAIAFERPDVFALGCCAALAPTVYVAGQLELTSECFQHCKGCESWRDHLSGKMRAEWGFDQVIELFSALNEMPSFRHLSLTGGDPQAWPSLNALLNHERNFKLQLNTALCGDPDWSQWRNCIDELRVSLDALTSEVYRNVRGKLGQITTPDEVLDRMWKLDHPNLAINITVYNENISDVFSLLRVLDTWPAHCIRKINVMRGIGARGFDSGDEKQWKEICSLARSLDVATNLDFEIENPKQVRDYLSDESLESFKHVRCFAGCVSFHIKANGDLYPCCLVGGEALRIHQSLMRADNLRSGSVLKTFDKLARTTRPVSHYLFPGNACLEICQWKQFAVNCVGELASNQKYAMP